MRNVSDRSCRDNTKTHILCSRNFYFRKSYRLSDNAEKYCTARQATDCNIIWRMRFASWISKVTNTHTEYVILIAFPLQQWLGERASELRHTYSACLVLTHIYIQNSFHQQMHTSLNI
jgi:hypothetical protein